MVNALKGLMKVKKTLASGKVITYCYAWRGGPLLKHEDGSPIQPGDAELDGAFVEAKERSKSPEVLKLNDLITRYQGSSDFQRTSAATKREYVRYLDLIRGRFSHLTLGDLQDPRTRGALKEWRDEFADTPRTADFAWSTLARLLSFGKDRGWLSVNIAERGGRLYRSDRRDKIWKEADIAAFMSSAPSNLCLALHLALWTGQRKGDLLRLQWSNYDGNFIHLRQAKTRTRLKIPVAAKLRAVLDGWKSTGSILKTSRGQEWTVDGFNTSWRKACEKAGIDGLTFHDLRGTAATRMALAGCTVSEIASITGHSLRDVDQLLDMHYLGGRQQLAERAISKVDHSM